MVNSDESEEKSTIIHTCLLRCVDCNGRLTETLATRRQADLCAYLQRSQPQAPVVIELASKTAINAPIECDFDAFIGCRQRKWRAIPNNHSKRYPLMSKGLIFCFDSVIQCNRKLKSTAEDHYISTSCCVLRTKESKKIAKVSRKADHRSFQLSRSDFSSCRGSQIQNSTSFKGI